VRPTPPTGDQGTLFPEPTATGDGTEAADPPEAAPDEGRHAALERSVDEVRARFGPGAVGHGTAHSLPGEGPSRPTR
jgi:hypothetical protein